jgi:hypothetical protein
MIRDIGFIVAMEVSSSGVQFDVFVERRKTRVAGHIKDM